MNFGWVKGRGKKNCFCGQRRSAIPNLVCDIFHGFLAGSIERIMGNGFNDLVNLSRRQPRSQGASFPRKRALNPFSLYHLPLLFIDASLKVSYLRRSN